MISYINQSNVGRRQSLANPQHSLTQNCAFDSDIGSKPGGTTIP